MWIENIGFCKKPSIVFSLCWENFSELYHLYLKNQLRICCKLHYLNLFMNHLKFNVSFDFFTTILSVLLVFVYFEMNIESVTLKRWFWWWQKCHQLEPVCCKKQQKKVPDLLLVCRIGDLNDSILIVYESK